MYAMTSSMAARSTGRWAATGNLTTARYAHVVPSEIADALQRVAESRKKSQTANKSAA